MGTLYCTSADLPQFVNPIALASVPLSVQDQACVSASETADSYLRVKYPLPLKSFGGDVTRYAAYIAIRQLLVARGYNPAAGADSAIETNYRDAVGWPDKPGSGWFPAVARGSIIPDVTVFQPTPPTFQLPQVWSHRPFGWTSGRGGI
jgi:phage gp36-like protein